MSAHVKITKDDERYLGRVKREESLVEDHSTPDIPIGPPTSVKGRKAN